MHSEDRGSITVRGCGSCVFCELSQSRRNSPAHPRSRSSSRGLSGDSLRLGESARTLEPRSGAPGPAGSSAAGRGSTPHRRRSRRTPGRHGDLRPPPGTDSECRTDEKLASQVREGVCDSRDWTPHPGRTHETETRGYLSRNGAEVRLETDGRSDLHPYPSGAGRLIREPIWAWQDAHNVRRLLGWLLPPRRWLTMWSRANPSVPPQRSHCLPRSRARSFWWGVP